MLTQLHISNFITIHELTLEFKPGTTVITGETGAGKSILIDAIQIALGDRATPELIRQGQDKAEIILHFDISTLPEAKTWLEAADLLNDAPECLIRRTIYPDGRSRSYINGKPSTLPPIRELGDLLMQIHSQNEHQALLKTDLQLQLLDRYAGHNALLEQTMNLAQQWHLRHEELTELKRHHDETQKQSALLSFQHQELTALQLTDGEFAALDLEHKQLAHADELLKNIHQAIDILTEHEEQNAASLIQDAIDALETVAKIDPKSGTWLESLKSALVHINDTEDELKHYLERIELDPERLQWVEQRISTLFDIARKYKTVPQELFTLQQQIEAELNQLKHGDTRLTELATQLSELQTNYHSVAKKLSASRKKAATKLSHEITQIIQQLALPHAEFAIQFEPVDPATPPTTKGLERIVFQIKTNVGHALQPLAKIASGGELSRVGLAIYIATAEHYTPPSIIFDEVDVGVSGGTAELVGQLLRRLGETHQIFCITHQPQVAALGHQHVRVTKLHKANATYTFIQPLSSTERISEIARMLGGVEITKTTLAHAQEMVEKVISS